MLLATLFSLCVLQTGAGATPPTPSGDPARDITSSDASVRLAAVKTIAEKGHTQAEALLLPCLADDDWEVRSIAAGVLGELRVKKALEPLLEQALAGPVRGLRRAAAEALARIDAAAAYEKLAKRLSGDETERACEALESLGPALSGKLKAKELEKLDKLVAGRVAGQRRAAARARIALAGDERAAKLGEYLGHEDLAVRAAAIEAAGASGDARLFDPLARQLENASLADFLARRVAGALRALVLAHPEKRAEFLAALARLAETGPARAPVARVLGGLAEERAGKRALEPAEALTALAPLLASSTASARAAAAAACARVGTGEALAEAAKLAQSDSDARVRRIALASAARMRGAKDDATRALLLAAVAGDADARVRETAASYLGVRGKPDVLPVLQKALADPDWRVMTSAAVALGKTEDASTAQALIDLYRAGGDDWKKRGSAIAGLTRLRAPTAVPVLIAALEDPEGLVSRTALEFLCQVSRQRLEPKSGPWAKWWEMNQTRIKLSIPEAILEARKKLAYATTETHSATLAELFSGAYAGVDLLVLQSRGDHIENVLSELSIEHRRTSSGQVAGDGLDPSGVFVANCTGEITADERERLSWFVRAGGALFGSCWALEETVQGLEPGLVRKLETKGEVLGDVLASAVDPGSPYLEGVAGADTRPIYHLEGAYLIDVLDPEEVEVLVDSPECAATFGGADLAAWFPLGHGVVLDSANHFEGQGFRTASLRTPEERMAYAIDHLGLSYAELRAMRAEKFWGKTASVADHVRDLSVFRLITNLVWLKHLAEE